VKAIRVENLTKRFAHLVVVDHISFRIGSYFFSKMEAD